jgi:predicted AlkP superfamily pyrophosphatase or phosphodiesterase
MGNKILVVMLDGLGYSEISKEKTPFLFNFIKKNSLARLKTLLAFEGIEYSFFNGDLPDKNGKFLEFRYSPKTSPFKWQKFFKFLGRNNLSYLTAFIQYMNGRDNLTKVYNIPFDKMNNFDASSIKPKWQLPMFNSKRFVFYKWPIFVKNGEKKLKLKYESDIERCKTMISSISNDTDFYSVQLLELDKAAHKYGKDSREYIEKVKNLDSCAKFIYENFSKRINGLDVIFWSDHSFLNIKEMLDVRGLLPNSKDYLVFIGGTTLSFWFKNEEIKKKIIQELEKIKQGHILTEKEIKKYKIKKGKENGELFFVMHPGNYIFPNYYQIKEPYKAMHGYEPDKCDCDGILISNKKLKKRVYQMNEVYELTKDNP